MATILQTLAPGISCALHKNLKKYVSMAFCKQALSTLFRTKQIFVTGLKVYWGKGIYYEKVISLHHVTYGMQPQNGLPKIKALTVRGAENLLRTVLHEYSWSLKPTMHYQTSHVECTTANTLPWTKMKAMGHCTGCICSPLPLHSTPSATRIHTVSVTAEADEGGSTHSLLRHLDNRCMKATLYIQAHSRSTS